MWTDEAMVQLIPPINKQNDRSWSDSPPSPSKFIQAPKHPKSLMIWCGFGIETGLIGPFFIDGSINEDTYPPFIINKVVPEMRRKLGDKFDKIIFQQDGASNSLLTLACIFGDRLLSLKSETIFPSNSPDLTPLDYYFWNQLKNGIFKNGWRSSTNPETVDELKSSVIHFCKSFDKKNIEMAVGSFIKRCKLVMKEEGKHIEHLVK